MIYDRATFRRDQAGLIQQALEGEVVQVGRRIPLVELRGEVQLLPCPGTGRWQMSKNGKSAKWIRADEEEPAADVDRRTLANFGIDLAALHTHYRKWCPARPGSKKIGGQRLLAMLKGGWAASQGELLQAIERYSGHGEYTALFEGFVHRHLQGYVDSVRDNEVRWRREAAEQALADRQSLEASIAHYGNPKGSHGLSEADRLEVLASLEADLAELRSREVPHLSTTALSGSVR